MIRYKPERLNEVYRFLNLKISKEDELQEIVELSAHIFNAPIAMITLIDGETQFIKTHLGTEKQTITYENTFCQYTVENNEMLTVEDTTLDLRFSQNKYVTGHPNIRFYAGIPLITNDGNSIGTLCVFDIHTKKTEPLQQEMLKSLSKQVIRILEFDLTLQILKDQCAASVKSNNMLLTYFENSSPFHFLVDHELNIIAYNKIVKDFVFKNRNLVIKTGKKITDYLHDEIFISFMENYSKALKGESIVTQHKLGYAEASINWHITYVPAYENGNIIGVSFNATDVTKNVNNQQHLSYQFDAISKINELQASEILQPIEKIKDQMESLSQLVNIDSRDEFGLLRLAVNDLLEKREKIIIINGLNQH